MQVLQAANTGITSLQKLVDTAKSIANQVLQTSVGYSTKANVDVTGTGAGVGATTAADLNAGKLGGSVITFKTATGTLAVTIGSTFATGSGTATVKTLDQLNSVLAVQGVAVSASISSTADTLTFTSTNDAASQTITSTGTAPTGEGVDIQAATATVGTVNAAVADAASQTTRANLVTQYNDIIPQITTTAQDASFNGINLLNGDNLKLTFNETGKSTLNIQGVTFNATGLGLASLTAGTDFLDNTSANKPSSPSSAPPAARCDRGFGAGFEPVGRADPSGLLQEPDQRAADRLVQPDAGRHQRGSGQQPGAVDPPVDRGVRAGAGQPVAAERAPAAALISRQHRNEQGGGGNPAAFRLFGHTQSCRRPARRFGKKALIKQLKPAFTLI